MQNPTNMKTVALVRRLPSSFSRFALRSDPTAQINQSKAFSQHEAYVNILRNILGNGNIIEVEPLDQSPDSCFVEDTVVVLRPRIRAISLTLGSPSRRAEATSVLNALRTLHVEVDTSNRENETLDGGDVLCLDNHIIVGLSERTNVLGAKRFAHLAQQIQPGVQVSFVKVPQGLHLKSLCSVAGPNLVVAWSRAGDNFLQELKRKCENCKVVLVPEAEAANCLLVTNQTNGIVKHDLILRKEYPTSCKLVSAEAGKVGVSNIWECDMSEIAKADGALTCCSVLVDANSESRKC